MKIVIAAAGKGTRLGELTKDKPKHIIEVAGRPFLSYLLDNIKKADFEEIIVVGGYKINKMKEFLDSYDSSIRLVDQHEYIKDDSYGTACPIKAVKDFINEDFVFISGDNLFSDQDLVVFRNLDNDFNYIAGLQHDEPNNFGVLKKQDDFLEEIVEKPAENVGNLINASLYKFTPEIFEVIEQINKSVRGEFEITDAVNLLARQKKVKVVELSDYWYDFGRPEQIKIIEDFLCKKL